MIKLPPSAYRAARRLMTDTCKITRLATATNPNTGREYAKPFTVYEGACKLQTYEPYEQTPVAGGHTTVVQRYSVHLPVKAGEIFRVGDVVEVEGRKFRIAGLNYKTHQTAIRLLVDEVVA